MMPHASVDPYMSSGTKCKLLRYSYVEGDMGAAPE